MDFINNLMIKAALRGLLVAASGIAVGNGYTTDSEFQTLSGAVLGIATIVWQIYSRSTHNQIKDTISLPSVAKIMKTSGKTITTPADVSNTDSAR